ncbi:helix-turn-helix domain-containing protein [Acidocella aminolytica]|jgi:CRP/FNR family nitrogen fixation transcriptional regulator|uniref:Transcriptional regulator cAMP-binding AadR/Crp/Fnr n=1 Tax=Acidocella aminolytica 101 = DSM 11237 TaxID=1120923 RepID=A0A0D6PLQ8_9PROT|nr:helix-turn-helix domain-containing protein [Acidocella aminolytica]GAN82158.1 transcriptional regulator cAMP-binding AadR/Crp/Fnr [Acidocella aminolytica 101 = DSM 11237]GBQ43242.1 cAMP-binding protein [Acidocella aminolytica 101 = DSM 11237]SHF55946.1 CRP/FNR family transcriptional regulator, nitrogen fixation regulation protein [Acidocella aminolytica 101 = DSM 11237]
MSATMMLQKAGYETGMMPPGLMRPAFAEVQALLHFTADESILSEGDEAGWMYRLVSGMARGCKFMADGRRHIDAFYRPGDVFGFELGGEHQLSVEAVTACTLVKLRRPGLESGADAAQLCHYAMRSLAHAQAHAQLLGRCSAGQKLAAFLLEMSANQQGEVLELLMARHDIADYLGLTVETVSRTMAQLEKEGAVKLIAARRIRIVSRRGLAALCG